MAPSSWDNWGKPRSRKFPPGSGASHWASAARNGTPMTRPGKKKKRATNRVWQKPKEADRSPRTKTASLELSYEKQKAQAAAALCRRNQGHAFCGHLRGAGAGAGPQQAAQGAAAIREPERSRSLASQRRRPRDHRRHSGQLSGKISQAGQDLPGAEGLFPLRVRQANIQAGGPPNERSGVTISAPFRIEGKWLH